MTYADQMEELSRSIVRVQLLMAEALSPAISEAAFRMGKFALAYYLSMPWYRRLWHDIRTGRVVGQVTFGLKAMMSIA